MTVKRIIADLATQDCHSALTFYRDFLGLKVVMDAGWIITLAGEKHAPVQISIASEGGSGTPVPDLSIEVDNLDELHTKAREMGFEITYPLTLEPWGVRRFFVRDPLGKIVNILAHEP